MTRRWKVCWCEFKSEMYEWWRSLGYTLRDFKKRCAITFEGISWSRHSSGWIGRNEVFHDKANAEAPSILYQTVYRSLLLPIDTGADCLLYRDVGGYILTEHSIRALLLVELLVFFFPVSLRNTYVKNKGKASILAYKNPHRCLLNIHSQTVMGNQWMNQVSDKLSFYLSLCEKIDSDII